MKLGRLQWGGIVIATLLLVVMAPSDNETGAKPKDRSGNQRASDAPGSEKSRTREVGHVELDRLAKLELLHKDPRKVGDAFNTSSWDEPVRASRQILPSTPVVQAASAVTVPTAPPMPFTYLGRYGDTASRSVILAKGDRVYTVAVGEVIENMYRVEKFTYGMVNLTYMPLGLEQHLPTGEAM
jgi:hypothetical protein